MEMPTEYFVAIGQMQHVYTNLEYNIANEIGFIINHEPNHTNYTDEKFQNHVYKIHASRAVVGGLRMSAGIDAIKRLFRAINVRPEIQKYMTTIWSQASEIQHFRNRITHYKTDIAIEDTGFQFVNYDSDVAKEAAKEMVYLFNLDLIQNATHDLCEIDLKMGSVCLSIFENREYPELETPTWRYKPSELVRPHRRSRGSPLPLAPRQEA
jgi:hypothetical protein